MVYERVVLTGFMGAGKTTVGRLLAPLLDWQFLDSDAVLIAKQDQSIAELFTQWGEPGFRKHEAQLIFKLLQTRTAVIALGGGAIEHAGTRALLTESKNTLLVYLQAPLEVSLARCEREPDAAVRPVLQDQELLRQRFDRRGPLYEAADLVVCTEGRTPKSIAGLIAAAARKYLPPVSLDDANSSDNANPNA